MLRPSCLKICVAMCLLGGLTGCGGKPSVSLVKVDGKVTLDGEPLADAKVNFIAEKSGSKNTPLEDSAAVTDTKGQFQLRGMHGEVGAMVGKHKVIISKMVTKDGKSLLGEKDPAIHLGVAKESLPKKYSTIADSELTADVPAKGGSINFELKSKP